MTLLTNTLLISINNPVSLFLGNNNYVNVHVVDTIALVLPRTYIHVYVHLEISMAKAVYSIQNVSRFLRSNFSMLLSVGISK